MHPCLYTCSPTHMHEETPVSHRTFPNDSKNISKNLWAIPDPVLWSINRWHRIGQENITLNNNGCSNKQLCRNKDEDNASRMLKCVCVSFAVCGSQSTGERKPRCEEVRPRCISLQLAALLIDTCVKWHHEPENKSDPILSPSFTSHKWVNRRWRTVRINLLCINPNHGISHSIQRLQEAWHIEMYYVTSSTCMMMLRHAHERLHEWDGAPDDHAEGITLRAVLISQAAAWRGLCLFPSARAGRAFIGRRIRRWTGIFLQSLELQQRALQAEAKHANPAGVRWRDGELECCRSFALTLTHTHTHT